MQITILGAAGGEVTGSAYYVQTKQANVLVDCGMFQGGKKVEALNHVPISLKQKLDAVLVTHGHLDHTGRLPLLAKQGLRMPVFATPATIEMTALILLVTRMCSGIVAGCSSMNAVRCNRMSVRSRCESGSKACVIFLK